MNRIPPSKRIRKLFDTLLNGNWEPTEDLVSRHMLLGSQLLAQESLEREATDYLEREHYQRRKGDQEHRGYREQARGQLAQRQRARRKAEHEGLVFDPQPLTFSFHPNGTSK